MGKLIPFPGVTLPESTEEEVDQPFEVWRDEVHLWVASQWDTLADKDQPEFYAGIRDLTTYLIAVIEAAP